VHAQPVESAAAAPPAGPPLTPAAPRRHGTLEGAEFASIGAALSTATDIQKLAVMVVGLVVTSTIAGFVQGLGSPAGGSANPFGASASGIGPGGPGLQGAVIGIVLGLLLAAVIWWIGSSLTIGTVTRMCMRQLATGNPESWRSALTYAARHIDGFLLGPLVFGVMLLLLVIAEIIVLLVGRIPFLGELVIAVAFLPLLVLNLVGGVLLIFGWFMLFPVVAAEGASAISAALRVMGVIRRDPLRVTIQLSSALFMAFIVTLVLGAFMVMSIATTLGLSYIGVGADKTSQIWLGLVPFASVVTSFLGGNQPFTIEIARFVTGVAFKAFVAGLLALPSVFLIASGCGVYLAGAHVPQLEEVRPVPAGQPVLVPDAAV
jgi:hypothetical protein